MEPAQDLSKVANRIRADVLEMVCEAGAGHVAGPLSSADLFCVLYFGGVVKFDPKMPDWEERDRVVLSCGHYCPVLYSSLARSGYFPISELMTFMKIGSRLPGHPEKDSAPGIEVSSGPLGQGISVSVGMALALKMKYGYRAKKDTPKVFCILSDGELQEGQTWEAFNFAVRRQLDNLIFVLDRNRIQIENYISQIATYGEVEGRLEAFGLHVLQVDGGDIKSIQGVLTKAKDIHGGPAIVVMKSLAGKGVSFMEGRPEWHDKVPTKDQFNKAMVELGVNT